MSQRHTTPAAPPRIRCYIAASSYKAIAAIQRLLAERQIDIVNDPMATNTEQTSLALRGALIAEAELCIGILGDVGRNTDVFFSIGYAAALHKRILIITPPGSEHLPIVFASLAQVRAELDDIEPIDFILNQVLAAPKLLSRDQAPAPNTSHAVAGPVIQQLLSDATEPLSEERIQRLVITALRASGVAVIVENVIATIDQATKRIDLGVWLEEADPAIGNPLLIEIRSHITTEKRALQMRAQVEQYLHATSTRTAVIVYLDSAIDTIALARPEVLFLPVHVLLEQLQIKGFGAIVRDLQIRAAQQVAA